MQSSIEMSKKQKRLQHKRLICCSSCSRPSVSSSEESEISNSDRYRTISSIAHAMVQERLNQMIRERTVVEEKKKERIRRSKSSRGDHTTKFVVMVAVEKLSDDPREDFRESIAEMIVSNKIREARDLRRLLDYYLRMNLEELRGIILEVFHDVCSDLFGHCKRH